LSTNHNFESNPRDSFTETQQNIGDPNAATA